MIIWKPLLGKSLQFMTEPANEMDKNAVAVFLFLFFFFNWDSFHARLNSHYKAWSYKKKKHKKIKAQRKSV